MDEIKKLPIVFYVLVMYFKRNQSKLHKYAQNYLYLFKHIFISINSDKNILLIIRWIEKMSE